MARIRTIKPEFWTSPTVVSLTPYARLLFIGAWNFADDWGLLLDDPDRLRLQVLPADSVDGPALVEELVNAGLFARLTAPTGDRLLAIPTWANHQRIDSRTVGRWGNPTEWAATPDDPAQSRAIPHTPALGSGREVEGNGSSSSADGFTTRPVDNPVDDDRTSTIAGLVVANRLTAQRSTVKNPAAWRRRVVKNLRTEDDGAWWARLEQLVAEHPDAPADLLALAADGEYQQSLRYHRAKAPA